MIGVMTTGANSSVRSTLRLLIRELTPSASASPITFCRIVIEAAISTVLPRAATVSRDENSAVKLSSPMKLIELPRPLQSVNA